jgi:hypothetical protein
MVGAIIEGDKVLMMSKQWNGRDIVKGRFVSTGTASSG